MKLTTTHKKKKESQALHGSSLFKLKKAAYFFLPSPSAKNTRSLATNNYFLCSKHNKPRAMQLQQPHNS